MPRSLAAGRDVVCSDGSVVAAFNAVAAEAAACHQDDDICDGAVPDDSTEKDLGGAKKRRLCAAVR